MKIITISREFGSGGRELGRHIADLLDCDYYDSEIIAAVAQKSGLDANYVENTLSNHGWQNVSVTHRPAFASAARLQTGKVGLLLEQKRVIEAIAKLGKDCVIVGRNADVILAPHQPFNLFVCAETAAKLKRCMERAPEGEKLSERELLHKMKQIDKVRTQTRAILSGSQWGQRDAYHLTVNTSDWNIKDLAPAVAGFAAGWFGRKQ
ncbi:MAG: cytidylate kinase-like family protein [Lachnospiraceae bacterium]|nr:cytidylate kinase-like family protein [Lachnospiraceae bacterium]MDE7272378.1 cytidylate kinase-like family protein [Lachnospiraceae bacterium]